MIIIQLIKMIKVNGRPYRVKIKPFLDVLIPIKYTNAIIVAAKGKQAVTVNQSINEFYSLLTKGTVL